MTAACKKRGCRRPRHGSQAAAAALTVALAAVAALPAALAAASCYRTLPRADFPYCQLLAPSFALHWRVQPGGNITLGLDVDTGGADDPRCLPWLACTQPETPTCNSVLLK